jgi:hypothetical protein
MDEDNDLHSHVLAANISGDDGTQIDASQGLSSAPSWTTFTPRRQATAKKHKTATRDDLVTNHNDKLSDTTKSTLRKAGIEDITAALGTSPNISCPPTTKTNSHYLRRGGVTDVVRNQVTDPRRIIEQPMAQSTGTADYELGSTGTNDRNRKVSTETVLPSNPSLGRDSSRILGPMANINKPAGNLVLPTNSSAPEGTSTTFYTYRAQLTFGLPHTSDGVNVAKYFRRWIFSSCESIDHFALVPYEEDKGQQISSLDQVPEDNMDFYSTYYHNHRVLNTGNLTGMVTFQCSTPWARLKSPNSPFFNWLRLNKVFLNQTKFKTSTLVPCGFLLGAHPGHLRRDEAESELHVSLGFDDEDELPFQLSSRSVSVPIQEGKTDRFVFQAVIVETSTQQAASLRERFFSLGNPEQAQQKYPYTGKYQFVPFLKTKEWTVPKILRLARLHVKIVQDLRPIFLANLKDIRNSIAHDGTTLMEGFYGMQYTIPAVDDNEPMSEPLLHSIHNTGKPTTKVALVSTCHYDAALTQLSAIHSILTSYIPQDYLDKVFIDSLQAGITGQQIDSVSSCNSAAYATELLSKYNPQDGEDLTEMTPTKRFRQVPLTYAAAASVDTTSDVLTTPSNVVASSVTSADLDHLFEKMKTYIAGSTDTSGVNIEELEARISQSTKEVQEVRDQLGKSVSSITARVNSLSDEIKTHNEKISADIQRQNVIILGMQQQFQDTLSDFSAKLQALYNHSGNTTNVPPFASTSNQGQWGAGNK